MAIRDPSKAALPLDAHPAMRATSTAGVEEAISREFGHVRLIALQGDADDVDARANHCVLSKVAVWSSRYTVPVAVGLSEGQAFGMRFQRRGSAAVTIGSRRFAITDRSSCIVSHGIPAIAEYCRDYEQVLLRIDGEALRTKLAAIAGRPVPRQIVFQPDVDLETPAAQFLRSLFDAFVSLLDRAGPSLPPLVVAEFEQALMVAFLASNRHSYSHWMAGTPPGVAPWQVTRAEDYIEANWHRPLEIETIAAETGTSGRSIFRAFKQSRGYSPFEFIKHVRLQHARRMIEQASDSTTVTDVAMASGFGDHGRFSKAYRQRFGELPSAALARTRGAVRSGRSVEPAARYGGAARAPKNAPPHSASRVAALRKPS